MSVIRFVTDSASDISVEAEKEYGIVMMNFPVSFGDTTYISRVDFDNTRFYEMLDRKSVV